VSLEIKLQIDKSKSRAPQKVEISSQRYEKDAAVVPDELVETLREMIRDRVNLEEIVVRKSGVFALLFEDNSEVFASLEEIAEDEVSKAVWNAKLSEFAKGKAELLEGEGEMPKELAECAKACFAFHLRREIYVSKFKDKWQKRAENVEKIQQKIEQLGAKVKWIESQILTLELLVNTFLRNVEAMRKAQEELKQRVQTLEKTADRSKSLFQKFVEALKNPIAALRKAFSKEKDAKQREIQEEIAKLKQKALELQEQIEEAKKHKAELIEKAQQLEKLRDELLEEHSQLWREWRRMQNRDNDWGPQR